MLSVFASWALFYIYTVLVHHKALPMKKHLIAAHTMFAAINGVMWAGPSYNLPPWVIIPLLINSSRIELMYFKATVHANNIGFALVVLMKNSIPIGMLFIWANLAGMSAAFVLSILSMDGLFFIMEEVRSKHTKKAHYIIEVLE